MDQQMQVPHITTGSLLLNAHREWQPDAVQLLTRRHRSGYWMISLKTICLQGGPGSQGQGVGGRRDSEPPSSPDRTGRHGVGGTALLGPGMTHLTSEGAMIGFENVYIKVHGYGVVIEDWALPCAMACGL